MKIYRLFTKTEYAIGYRFSEKGLPNDMQTPFRFLLPDKETWFADPFVYMYCGEYYVFMEIFFKNAGYGVIGFSKYENGRLTPPKVIINEGSHMSFPMIFVYNEKIYMVPETISQQKIKMYECKEFPEKWAEVHSITKGSYYDTVLFHDDYGSLYAFSSQPTKDMYGSRLYLMKLSNDGLPIIQNIKLISEDYRISRQAGNILYSDGCYYRIAQDCSNGEYGQALEYMKIINLDMNDYYETPYARIEPQNINITGSYIHGKAGIHTNNKQNDFEVIDLKIYKFSFRNTILKTIIVLKMLKNKCLFKRSS